MQKISVITMLLLYFRSVSLVPTGHQDKSSPSRHTRQVENSGCTLPSHPDHGQWSLLKDEGRKGVNVPISSVILFECSPGYKLSSKIPLICLGQWSAQVPTCESKKDYSSCKRCLKSLGIVNYVRDMNLTILELCPPLHPSDTYDLKCINKIGKEVNCSEATDGTNLDYNCKNFYETPFGFKKTLFCEDGKWDYPKPVCQPVCGKKATNDTNELIYGSKPSDKIEYPWVAAIYEKLGDSYENICGGSILSQTVVLTAAHCVTNNRGEVLPKENYMVGVGKLYRSYLAPEDTRAQYSELLHIFVPKEYEADIKRYAADIAVLVVKEKLIFNEMVQPVCFTNLKSIRLHPGHKGEVSGWGLAEGDRPSEVLRSLVIPYKYETVCADELPAEWGDRYNLADKMCAGFVNKSTSVCKGDSGAGLAFKYREDNRYYVHGVVSVGHKMGGVCNIQQNAIYTKVASYYEFVNRLLTTYAPKSKDCILPPYPKNGKWTTYEWNWQPGDVVSSDTILNVVCNEGYKVSSKRIIDCSTGHNMPTCQKLCPELEDSTDTIFRCGDKYGNFIDCFDSTDGTYLWYKCPPGYTTPYNASTAEHICVKGSWVPANPKCIRVVKDCGKKVEGSEMEYPWNVGVYKISNNTEEKYKFVCSGSLISEYAVITDTQCVTDEEGNVLRKEDYLIAAGKFYSNYDDPRDVHAQFSNLSAITIHPKYKATHMTMYSIVLLIASTSFSFNSFVQQVCLIDVETFLNTDDDKIVGWKFTEGASSEKIESLQIEYLAEDCCKVPSPFNSLFDVPGRTCSSFMNNYTCLLPEESGKGLIGTYEEDGRYYLQGVVNYFKNSGCQNCFWNTDLFYYIDFINNAVF